MFYGKRGGFVVKRVLAVAITFIIVCVSIAFPGIVGGTQSTYALTNNQRLMMYSPAFWGWFWSQTAGMGMQAQNLGEALDYMNRNGDLDEFLDNAWEGYQNGVQEIPRAADVYFRTVATFWRDLFTGNLDTWGIQILAEGSSDPQSVWYVDPADSSTNYSLYPATVIGDSTPLQYFNAAAGATFASQTAFFSANGNEIYQIGNTTLSIEYDVPRLGYSVWFRKTENGTTTNMYHYIVYDTLQSSGKLMLLLQHINPGGTPDANGNVYKLVVAFIVQHAYDNVQPYRYTCSLAYSTVYDATVTPGELETITPITFDQSIVGKTFAEGAIDSGDYVGTIVDSDYMTELQMMIDRVRAGTATATDISMPDVDTQVRTETNNPAIAGVIPNTVVAAEVAVPNFPQIEQFKMPSGITTKFPFSIPWDLARAIQMLNYSAEIPIFTVPFKIESINFQYDMVLDFTQFALLAKICRFMVLAGFIVGLIIATRQLIKG